MRRSFREIAATSGNKSQDKKIALITKLLVSSRDLEPGYIMRALQVPQPAWDCLPNILQIKGTCRSTNKLNAGAIFVLHCGQNAPLGFPVLTLV